MLFDGLGGVHRKVTIASQEAQDFFDQGLKRRSASSTRC